MHRNVDLGELSGNHISVHVPARKGRNGGIGRLRAWEFWGCEQDWRLVKGRKQGGDERNLGRVVKSSGLDSLLGLCFWPF